MSVRTARCQLHFVSTEGVHPTYRRSSSLSTASSGRFSNAAWRFSGGSFIAPSAISLRWCSRQPVKETGVSPRRARPPANIFALLRFRVHRLLAELFSAVTRGTIAWVDLQFSLQLSRKPLACSTHLLSPNWAFANRVESSSDGSGGKRSV